jgi:hypothetical protein
MPLFEKKSKSTPGEPAARCAFCGKSQQEVKKLIAGPATVNICDACVGMCNDILDEETLPAAMLGASALAACAKLIAFAGKRLAEIPAGERFDVDRFIGQARALAEDLEKAAEKAKLKPRG